LFIISNKTQKEKRRQKERKKKEKEKKKTFFQFKDELVVCGGVGGALAQCTRTNSQRSAFLFLHK
jgi:hypothetical protein